MAILVSVRPLLGVVWKGVGIITNAIPIGVLPLLRIMWEG
eukprot:CAMPEP_0115288282 /NCGR_PEP_ID=MMETSP0270-20121206/62893_1 /TAXON_ID=71861 /ORGANISM="Scrippsiella trochoidea, Strain CCMP3099" /LENGTH=39 /DNA_ID= /DNA_START= /DNA_END= /DNA_ORIENTATION=